MSKERGFTLIEVIIILIVMSVAATLFVTYLGSSFTQSPLSSSLIGKQYRLSEQMEIVTCAYRQALEDGGSVVDLCAFKTANVDGLQIDGKSIVDTSNTSCTYALPDITKPVLLVTLTDGKQTLQSIFTTN